MINTHNTMIEKSIVFGTNKTRVKCNRIPSILVKKICTILLTQCFNCVIMEQIYSSKLNYFQLKKFLN